ncbi:cathepsin L isoform 1 [Tropilaelaps mercedesae]|uniref:Cathepsin L isoform 1 n=1 Tax=Tropilaelaps mercedesae TaxID=418985 RepID=A0A1V9XG30_9ACAR|nr:cathepsin L isoform 1 [Tropilaelaps mercedesae]
MLRPPRTSTRCGDAPKQPTPMQTVEEMKFIVLACAIGAATAALTLEQLFDAEWQHFKTRHAKAYDNLIIDSFRKKIFMQNSHMIVKHNIRHAKGEISYRLKMNEFGDMSSPFRTRLDKSTAIVVSLDGRRSSLRIDLLPPTRRTNKSGDGCPIAEGPTKADDVSSSSPRERNLANWCKASGEPHSDPSSKTARANSRYVAISPDVISPDVHDIAHPAGF